MTLAIQRSRNYLPDRPDSWGVTTRELAPPPALCGFLLLLALLFTASYAAGPVAPGMYGPGASGGGGGMEDMHGDGR